MGKKKTDATNDPQYRAVVDYFLKTSPKPFTPPRQKKAQPKPSRAKSASRKPSKDT